MIWCIILSFWPSKIEKNEKFDISDLVYGRGKYSLVLSLWSLRHILNERGDQDENFEHWNLSQTLNKCTEIVIWTFGKKQKNVQIFLCTLCPQKCSQFVFGKNYLKSSQNSKRKVSFKIYLFWGFQNWPYFWHLVK